MDGLLEQTVFIADAVSVEGDVAGCRRIKEAGSEPSESAVAEGSVLYILKHIDICAVLRQYLLSLIKKACAVKIIVYSTSHQELRRQIVCSAMLVVTALRLIPQGSDIGHHCTGNGIVELPSRGVSDVGAAVYKQEFVYLCGKFSLIQIDHSFSV